MTAQWRGQTYNRQRTFTVTPRANWKTPTPSAQYVLNGTDARLGPVLPDPPIASNFRLGSNNDALSYSYQFVRLSAGPNTGYRYVMSRTTSVIFLWTGSGALMEPTAPTYAAFNAANCGDYDAVLKPHGFTLAATLRENLIRHESGLVESHYAFFKTAFEQELNNPGNLLEAHLEVVESDDVFSANLRDSVDTAFERVSNARGVEPCGTGVANYDASCTYRGPVNSFPYAACPR